ncbi:MAG: FCD domain-containing protein [Usitatibacter sp.]
MIDLEATPTSQISLLQSKSLTQLVQGEIERQILSGKLKAGERLNEVLLAQKLKVSRGPIREALRTLQEAGLVSFEKNRGTAVRVISPEEATDIYEVRASLESLACRRLAVRVTPPIVAELQGLTVEMETAVELHDVAAFHHLNIAFHERIMEHAGNRALAVTYRRLVGNLTLFRQRTLAIEGSLVESNQEHRAIVALLAAGEAGAAAALMQQHIEESSERTRLALKHPTTTEEESR